MKMTMRGRSQDAFQCWKKLQSDAPRIESESDSESPGSAADGKRVRRLGVIQVQVQVQVGGLPFRGGRSVRQSFSSHTVQLPAPRTPPPFRTAV